MSVEDLADVDSFLQDRQNRLERLDRSRDGCELGVLFRLLTIEGGELDAMLVDLVEKRMA